MTDRSSPNKRVRKEDCSNGDDETSSIKKNCKQKNDKSIYLMKLHNICFQEIFGMLDFISLRRITCVCKYFSNFVTCSDVLIRQHIYSSIKDINININIQDKGYDVEKWNNNIMPCFDPLIFNHMSIFCQTPLFHLYSRLLSYNWTLHLLLMARSYNSIGANRNLVCPNISNDEDYVRTKDQIAAANKLKLFTIFETKYIDNDNYNNDNNNNNNNNNNNSNNTDCNNVDNKSKSKSNINGDNGDTYKYNYNQTCLKYFRKRKLHSNELELFADMKNDKEWFKIKTLLESKENMDVKFTDKDEKFDMCSTIDGDGYGAVCINDCQTFLSLLNQRFHYQKWKDILQNGRGDKGKAYNIPDDSFGNWFLAGGSVLYCIMKNARQETGIKDLDFFAVHMFEYQFWEKIFMIAVFFQSRGYETFFANNMKNSYKKLIVIDLYVNFSDKKSRIDKNTLPQYHDDCYYGQRSDHRFIGGRKNGDIVEKYESDIWSKFQFIYNGQWNCPSTILSILFDLDCCQVGFDGYKVLCSYAFIQSITTQTMIYYKLRNNTSERDLYIKRIKKYYQRGFDLLIPVKLSIAVHTYTNNIMIYMMKINVVFVLLIDHNYNFARFDIETLFREHTATDEEKFQQARKSEEKIVESAIAKGSNERFERTASNGFRINTDCLQVRQSFVNMLKHENARLSQN